MKITPLHEYVHIRPSEQRTQTVSGLYLKQTDEKSTSGIVIGIGTDVTKELKKGTSVLFEYVGVHELSDKTLLVPYASIHAVTDSI